MVTFAIGRCRKISVIRRAASEKTKSIRTKCSDKSPRRILPFASETKLSSRRCSSKPSSRSSRTGGWRMGSAHYFDDITGSLARR